MSRSASIGFRVLSLVAGLGLAGAALAADPLQPNSVWRGEIRQGSAAFATTIYIKARDQDRVRGEIHFKVGDAVNKLTFQGDVIEGRTVAWITDRKEGAVTYPGLYVGTLSENTLSGTWQVPSAKQYDRFTVKLAQ
ncbi:MAG TPA: hypothetical protein VM369_06650 [Candidatus Binatia bacterium]|nr:hypothetical protein [Candidatus Binatia bacterium]